MFLAQNETQVDVPVFPIVIPIEILTALRGLGDGPARITPAPQSLPPAST